MRRSNQIENPFALRPWAAMFVLLGVSGVVLADRASDVAALGGALNAVRNRHGAMTPRMFDDLPVCVAAFKARKEFDLNGR
jgi:hypothetical protein